MTGSPTTFQSRGRPVRRRLLSDRIRAATVRKWLFIIVFVVALLARAGWGTFRLVQAGDSLALEFPDEQQYWSMACSLRAGEGLNDELGFRATRMPLYPVFLSLFAGGPRGAIVARTFQWIIGAAAAVLTAAVAIRLFDRRVGWLAGLLVALDPFLVFFSSLLLTETGFVAALVGLWWLLGSILRTRSESLRPWTAVGFVAALCVYLRESSLGLVAAGLCFVVISCRFRRRTIVGAAIAGTVVIVSLVPWAARNQRVTGQWCWLTTRGGISLYDGVGPQATGGSDLGNIKQMPAVRNLSEAEWNRYFFSESWKSIKDDPRRIVRLAGTKLARMWNPFPNVDTYQSRLVRAVSVGWTIPTFTFALVCALLLPIRNKREGLRIVLFLLLPAIYLSVLHSLFVGSVRYRLGAVPMLDILAAVTILAVVDLIHKRGTTKERGLAR